MQLRRSGGSRGAMARIAARQATRLIRTALRNRATRRSVPNKTETTPAQLRGDNPLTTQHDFKVDYRRRRRTRRLRRRINRAKRFTKNVVNAYVRTMQSPKQVAKLAQFTRATQANFSNYFAVMLHTADGQYTGANPQADWREWFIEGSAQNRAGWDELSDPNALPQYPFVSERGRSIRCNSASMEVTIRNTGTTPAMLSVYRIVCRRDWPFVGQTVESIYEQGYRYAGRVTEHDQPVEEGIPAPYGMWDFQMQPEQLTSTPFQSYLFTRIFQIYRRTKYQLSPGEEINLNLKSNRPRIVHMEKARGKSVVRGLTHGYFVDFQGVPEYVETSPGVFETRSSAAQLTVQKMVRYSLTMMPGKRPATSYDTTDPDLVYSLSVPLLLFLLLLPPPLLSQRPGRMTMGSSRPPKFEASRRRSLNLPRLV